MKTIPPIHRHPFRPLIVAAILALAGSFLSAQSTTQGTLTGRVFNSATSTNLEGANVRVEGTTYATTTERDGTFRLRVPAGTHNLTASYLGLQTSQPVAVTVAAGGVAAQNIGLTSDVYRLEKFVVATEREGNALAITLQRQAPNVKSVVSADAFGALNGNPGEMLQRLPGVIGVDTGGEIRYVMVRGMSQELNTVTVDGNRMANAGSAGTNRHFQMQTMVSEGIERMEVTKSPTPDMDGDSIGGAVNMVSTSAFDRAAARRLSASWGATNRPSDSRDSMIHQDYSISYSEVFSDKVGVSFNYGKHQQLSSNSGTTQQHERVTTDPAYTWYLQLRDFTNLRTRWGGNLKLDYKLSEQTRLFLNSTMAKHFENENNGQAFFQARMQVATRDANGNYTGRGAILPGYTSTTTEWRGNTTNPADNFANLDAHSLNKDAEVWHHQIGAVHSFERMKLEYDVYYSDAHTEYINQGGINIRAWGVGMRLERDPSQPWWPRFTQISGPDIFDINSYDDYNLFNTVERWAVDNYVGAQLNLTRHFETEVPAYIKTGLRLREQTRDLHNSPQRYTYIGGDLASFVNPLYDDDLHGRYPDFNRFPILSIPFRDRKGSTRDYTGYNMATALRESPELFREDIVYNTAQKKTNELAFEETVSAAYLMGNIDLGKFSLLGGLRVEETKVWGEGAVQVITPEERARRAAWVGPVTDEEARRRIDAEFADPFEANGKYKTVFPGVHFKYEPVRGLLVRGSWATNIGRPNIGTLVPKTTVSYEAERVTINNPALKPQYADNFDLSLEYYFEPVGMLSAGLFLKEITDFIYTDSSQSIGSGPNNGFDGYYEGFSLQTQANGGHARVRGFELAYQQQFTFLPGWMSSFGGYANYTWLQTKGDYGSTTVRSTSEVAGFVPETANVGISYIRRGHSLRLQLNYIGRTLATFSTNQPLLRWNVAKPQLDLKAVFRINRRLDAYFDIWNVLANPTARAEYFGGRPHTISKMRPMFHVGLRGRL